MRQNIDEHIRRTQKKSEETVDHPQKTTNKNIIGDRLFRFKETLAKFEKEN